METPSMRHSVNNPSAQEWEVHHKTIKKLYVEDDLSLEALQAHMDTKHDFLAG